MSPFPPLIRRHPGDRSKRMFYGRNLQKAIMQIKKDRSLLRPLSHVWVGVWDHVPTYLVLLIFNGFLRYDTQYMEVGRKAHRIVSIKFFSCVLFNQIQVWQAFEWCLLNLVLFHSLIEVTRLFACYSDNLSSCVMKIYSIYWIFGMVWFVFSTFSMLQKCCEWGDWNWCFFKMRHSKSSCWAQWF